MSKESVFAIRPGSSRLDFYPNFLSLNLPVPAVGSSTFLITEIVAPPGFVPCLGGNHCPPIPPTAVVTAQTRMPFADGHIMIFPTDRSDFTARQDDPILFYDNQVRKKTPVKHEGKGEVIRSTTRVSVGSTPGTDMALTPEQQRLFSAFAGKP